MSSMQDLLRRIPSVEGLLQDDRLAEAAHGVPRKIVLECVRAAVEEARTTLVAMRPAPRGSRPPRSNLGRCSTIYSGDDGALLPPGDQRHGHRSAHGPGPRPCRPRPSARSPASLSGYSLLQADPATGQRAKRDARIQWLFQQLTGAEAATVVNNNAAATWIALSTVAAGREVIVSRGQLVEIGGSFRLPDVMAASGAKMVEVGTTNKTHARDYRTGDHRPIRPPSSASTRATTRSPASRPRCRWRSWPGSPTAAGWC